MMSDAAGNEARPPRGLKGDIHRAREGVKASADELRQFVGEFRGKSAQQMLGLVAGSNLVQSTILATIVTAVFLGGFTVGPYLWNKSHPPVAKKAKPEPAPAAAPKTDGDAAKTGPAATGTADAGKPGSATAAASGNPAAAKGGAGVPSDPPEPGSAEAMKRLGIGETKTLDPKSSPLDNSADDLLKDLGKKTK